GPDGGAIGGANLGGDALAGRLDANNNFEWLTIWGDNSAQSASTLFRTPSGRLLLTGQFDGTVALGGLVMTSDGDDFYVGELEPDGGHRWSFPFGKDVNAQILRGVSFDG